MQTEIYLRNEQSYEKNKANKSTRKAEKPWVIPRCLA